MRARQITTRLTGSLAIHGLSVLLLLAVCTLPSPLSWARVSHSMSGLHAQASHPAPAPQSHPSYSPPPQHMAAPPQHMSAPAQHTPTAPARVPEPSTQTRPQVHATVPPARPGQQHLPEWWNNHRTLSPQQQEDALRREPGFHNLPSDQQQRLVDRLHSLDQKSPEQQQRILARNEAFEHLSPERKQEVRGASQALGQMSPERQQVLRQAFKQLRQMPPAQRQQLLGSGAYASQFSPQERTVLGNLLSIEPYQHAGIPQPYFGR
jgi:hypothetical protein